MKKLIIAATAVGLGLWWYLKQSQASTDTTNENTDQLPTLFDTIQTKASDIMDSLTQTAPDTSAESVDTVAANRAAFLDMIAYSEGTANAGADGYRMMFGGQLASNLDDHPRKLFPFTDGNGKKLFSSAAGRYQFLSKTWDGLVSKLGLTDFSPESQDAACLELIRQRGALDDVDAGNVQTAIAKCAKTWASLPGAGYAQPERKLGQLLSAYTRAGGEVTTA